MICHRCGYVFIAEDAAVSRFDARVIKEHLTNFAACVVCVRCGHMQHIEQHAYDIRRYKATAIACQKIRDACDAGMVKVDWAETPRHSHRRIINGIGYWVEQNLSGELNDVD
jgi:uncharacterized Fe-S center protein